MSFKKTTASGSQYFNSYFWKQTFAIGFAKAHTLGSLLLLTNLRNYNFPDLARWRLKSITNFDRHKVVKARNVFKVGVTSQSCSYSC